MDSPSGNGHVIAIGASAGGVAALSACLAQRRLPVPVLIAMHLTANANTSLPAILERVSSSDVKLAEHGDPLVPGKILIAPPDNHLLVGRDRVRLSKGPRENRSRPAVDPLFRSAARSHGAGVIAVVLSGMLGDGAAGLAAVRRAGGFGIVQAPTDARFAGMPSAALEVAGADLVADADEIGEALERLSREEVADMPPAGDDERDIVELDVREIQRLTLAGDPTGLTCPDCHGALWETVEHGVPSMRCRVGHAFSLENLDEAQNEAVEQALWMAVRALEERASLLQRTSDRLNTEGPARASLLRRADASLEEAASLRRVLGGELIALSETRTADPQRP